MAAACRWGFLRPLMKLGLPTTRAGPARCFAASADVGNAAQPVVEEDPKPKQSQLSAPPEFRFIYPEFLPSPRAELRNKLCERLERIDMLRRRSQIDIPEFYVGSIMAVTASDPYADGKLNRFVGICTQRDDRGLRARFTLRNIVDNIGVEIMYELYNPTLQSIEVIRLEKRLDDCLRYLRDALPEYSTFPFDMETVVHPDGEPIPINPLKVEMKPRPWTERWERKGLEGVKDFGLPDRFYRKAIAVEKPWEKFDLMRHYRQAVTEEEVDGIYGEVRERLQNVEVQRKKVRRKRSYAKPTAVSTFK